MPVSYVCVIVWIQRHCSEQDVHDEQVIVVKQICKCQTIASHVMVCLWISRVIVPLQLGYLHNQLWGLAIMYFSLFAAVFSLQLAPCPIQIHIVYMHVFVLLYMPVWLRADRAYNSFSQINFRRRSQVIVHYVYIAFIKTCLCIFILFVHCCTEQ